MKQLTLRDVPDTSMESYHALDQVGLETIRAQCLAELVRAPGTTRELARRLGLDYMQVEKRCSELLKAGSVVRGEKTKNPDTGRNAYMLEVAR